eukprot:TRINITY_DN6151_c0_g1_i2.p1 TRINITY_DN6151_c0_g1~~TRINITY_DN6151_c0_g1_i2.p1  ORF type:complete len:107 (+),score=29.66 TRINITY_DN6151_c0_g1_i2:87-407(+)
MLRRPPRSTLSSSSAASDVYKRQYQRRVHGYAHPETRTKRNSGALWQRIPLCSGFLLKNRCCSGAVSYTHLTLPTKRIVQISVVAVALKKTKIMQSDRRGIANDQI